MWKQLLISLKINIRFKCLMLCLFFQKSITVNQYLQIAELTTRLEGITELNKKYFDWFNTVRAVIQHSVDQGRSDYDDLRAGDLNAMCDWTHQIVLRTLREYPEKSN